MFDRETLEDLLRNSWEYFIQINGDSDCSYGWKLSIQGKTIDDSMMLFDMLHQLLNAHGCSYKFGTQRLMDCGHPQQSTKLLTIYIPNEFDVKEFAEKVYIHMEDYKGGQDIKCPTSYEHYANAIYFRNDRDEYGNYIYAN